MMGKLSGAYVYPHPPVIIPEVGRGSQTGAEQTISAAVRAAKDIAIEKPSTIVIITPHGPVFQDFIYISDSIPHIGNLGKFGAPGIKFDIPNNPDLMNSIINIARREEIPCGGLNNALLSNYGIPKELDHGAAVPLYFVRKEYDAFKLITISIAGLPYRQLYRFGMCIAEAIETSDDNVVIIASGDLSHRLTQNAPYGYNKRGKEFDDLVIRSFRQIDVNGLLSVDEDLSENAGECGLRSFIIMFGALDGMAVESDVYSYEGPFGVGYSVARFAVKGKDDGRKLFDSINERNSAYIKQIRQNEDAYVSLARKTLETYVKERKIIDAPDGLPEEMLKNKAGVFVSIKKEGHLRGCIGTTSATRKNIAEEIIRNAISSGTRDPRFYPVEIGELDNLVYSVDVLNEAEPIKSIKELDVKKYGVIVRAGSRSGLLLPDLDGVDTPEKQVSIALQKAGIRPDEKYSMERFEVIRHR